MAICVSGADGVRRLVGDVGLVEIGNRWLAHLEARQFSPATVRGYLVCLARFLDDAGIAWDELVPSDVFDWLEWQSRPHSATGKVVRLGEGRGAAPATMNRRVAAARGLFEYAVMCGDVAQNPVPAPRRSTGLRSRRRGLLGHVAPRRSAGPGRLVRQDRPLPESVEAADIEVFLADLNTHRDRAITLAMLVGGLRASEVRTLRLADVDMGMRQVTVTGKGAKQRLVPIDRAFFTEVRAYLDRERPKGLATPECFVVLRGPTTAPRRSCSLRSRPSKPRAM